MNDTITAIATAHGVGAVCIVRLSGEMALSLANILTKNKALHPRHATLCDIFSSIGEFIDEGIVIYFKAPHSFTGEDVVEFQIHGGIVIADIIVNELVKLGARLANPGEFSKRAFLNDKMDLSKAENIQSMINAKSENAAKILARTMHGELSEFVNSLRSELTKTLAYIETCIDYAEDDLPPEIINQTQNLLDANIKKLSQISIISEQRRGLIDGFKIAIIGKPNVGKSSILNAMLKFNRAITSDIAGTTRDTIQENLKVGTHLVKIIDTAGIRNSDDNIESIGITHSINAANEADVIIAVFDGSKKGDEEDAEILEICKNSGKKILNVLNKNDLEFKFDINLDDPIKISAKKSTDEILINLEKYLNTKNYDGLMLSSKRQILASKNALKSLENAKELLNDAALELFAFEINEAIIHISSITKPFERSEILDEMFSNFCLGK